MELTTQNVVSKTEVTRPSVTQIHNLRPDDVSCGYTSAPPKLYFRQWFLLRDVCSSFDIIAPVPVLGALDVGLEVVSDRPIEVQVFNLNPLSTQFDYESDRPSALLGEYHFKAEDICIEITHKKPRITNLKIVYFG